MGDQAKPKKGIAQLAYLQADRSDPIHEVLLSGANAVGQEGVTNVEGRSMHTVQVTGPFTGSVELLGTLDDINFAPINADIAAPGIVTINGFYRHIKAKVKTLTTGAISVYLSSARHG